MKRKIVTDITYIKQKSKEVDKSYLAGLLDGEGSIMIHKLIYNTRDWHIGYSLKVVIFNNYKPILNEMQKKFGGHIFIAKKEEKNHNIGYGLYFGSSKANKLLEIIYPYLRIKKELAKLAIRFQTKKDKKREYLLVQRQKNNRGKFSTKKYPKSYWDFQEKIYAKVKSKNRRGNYSRL